MTLSTSKRWLIAAGILAAHTSLADFSGRVVGVHDGDTLTVMHGGSGEPVRLVGIDAPELHQDYGQKAKQALSAMCYGQTANVAETGRDRYGRILGRVMCQGKNANAGMVTAGLAWHFSKYSTDIFLRTAESTARNQKAGLWAAANTVPPWDYRKGEPPGASETASTEAASAPGQKYDCKKAPSYCKEMKTCEEATYYLTQCRMTKLDKDRDGKPCENVCGK